MHPVVAMLLFTAGSVIAIFGISMIGVHLLMKYHEKTLKK
jgi:hypothetical protein